MRRAANPEPDTDIEPALDPRSCSWPLSLLVELLTPLLFESPPLLFVRECVKARGLKLPLSRFDLDDVVFCRWMPIPGSTIGGWILRLPMP